MSDALMYKMRVEIEIERDLLYLDLCNRLKTETDTNNLDRLIELERELQKRE
jgi:hypothetical protein